MKAYTSNRTTNIYRKYKATAQRIKSGFIQGSSVDKTQQIKRLYRYERRLQRLGIAASLSLTLFGFSLELDAQVSPVGGEFQVQ